MNDPLHRALSDAESSDAAARYTVPVQLVRARVRRRRAVRAGGVAGVAALAVVAVVVAMPSFLSRTPAAGPPGPGVSADWPAQFDRCGKPVDDVLASTGDTSLDASLSRGKGTTIDVETSMSGPDGVAQGWVYGTELTVVDESGVVVGVQEGSSVPALVDLDTYYAGTDFALMPFPLRSTDDLSLVSCDQYPDGAGDIDLGFGDYRVWVTQTVGYDRGGTTHAARASVELPLVVGPGHTPYPGPSTPAPTMQPSSSPPAVDPTAGTPAADLFRCGEPVDVTIHTLPDAGGLTLAADLPDHGWGDVPPAWSVTIGSSDDSLHIAAGSAAGNLALVDDQGVVAGFVVPGRGPQRTVVVGTDARGVDATGVLDGPTLVVPCSDQLRGTYTAWPFVVETPYGGMTDDGQPIKPRPDVVVVANPRDVTFAS